MIKNLFRSKSVLDPNFNGSEQKQKQLNLAQKSALKNAFFSMIRKILQDLQDFAILRG